MPKGDDLMAQYQSSYRTLTLEACLEEVIRLGDHYFLSGGGEGWRASDLLAWLERKHPALLSLPVALVPPDATGYGAVFEVDLEGEPITDAPLYRLERRKPAVEPF
jgi:hypothetical protein